jgi:putative phosphoesterase
MKKITLISDTHGCLDEWILSHCDGADEIWHAGDIGDIEIIDELKELAVIRMVYGNIDGKDIRSMLEETESFSIEGLKVSMIHIGGYPNRYKTASKTLIQKEKPGLFITGHSHILKVQFDPSFNLLYLNPGAAGKHGFHKVRTLLKFNIDKGEIKDLILVEKER